MNSMNSNSPMPAVGIDLGTTYSVVSALDEQGIPRSLPNAEGELLTPSAVLFEGEQVIVGREALKAMGGDAIHVADCPKRYLGRRVYPRALAGKEYPPEVLQAWILNKLRLDAAQRLGKFRQVVITVPAYFDEVRRKATQDAGYMAGFDVLDIINEPTAAAVAFGFQQGYLSESGEARKAQNLMVYDLGGGTFDVTVMRIEGSEFKTLATDGDVHLGGRDWDQRMVDFVAEEFLRRYTKDLRDDPNSAARVWRECEEAKRTLSTRGKATVACDHEGDWVRTEITREQFESMTQDLLDRTSLTCQEALRAAGMDWGDLDRVLLVGGSTRMPQVRKMLADLSGREPDHGISPDEAVAHGAAIRTGVLQSQFEGRPPKMKIQSVNSHSLGVVGRDRRTDRRRTAVLIPRNTPLPTSTKRLFRTHTESQRSILVQIIEGENPNPDYCSSVGKCSVPALPKGLKAGSPIQVEFDYAENGRLKVQVTVPGTEIHLAHELRRENSLGQEQLDQFRREISGFPPPVIPLSS